MALFYAPDLDKNQVNLALPKAESHHLVKSLRKQQGDHISLTDGKGLLAEGTIISVDKELIVQVLSVTHCAKPILPSLAVAPPKSIERMLWLVEKATELGIDSITPLCCHHSERRQINTEKLQKTAMVAMKQSGRVYLPEIKPMVSFSEFLSAHHNIIAFGVCDKTLNRKPILEVLSQADAGYFLIGPEGDFSKPEIEQLMSRNVQPISLGDYILRTETAAITICLAHQLLNT